MTEVLLFHHVQGLTPGVVAFADRLRAGGHTVHTPDLFEGRTFDAIEDGMAFARATGFETIGQRALAAADALPAELVHAGMSLGGASAQELAQTRPGARGAVLLHSCMPTAEYGGWPADVPVQVHAMEHDPFFDEEGGDIDAAHALVEETDQAQLFLYPGDQHLFTDSSLPAYDEVATYVVVQRVLAFLEAVAT